MSVDRCVFIMGPDSGRNLLGIPILLRGILTVGRYGAKKISVVGGSPSDRATAESLFNDDRVKPWDLDIEYREMGGAGDVLPDGPATGMFWLVDGDCVFNDAVLADGGKPGTCDKARVMVTPGSDAKGKAAGYMSPTGVVLCPADLWPMLSAAVKKDGAGFSVERFIGGVPSLAVPVVGGFVVKPDGKGTEKAAVRALMTTARKPVDGFIARHFNRRISTFFSRRVVDLGIRPSVLSVFNFFIGLGGALAALSGHGYWSFVLGGLLFEAASILDGCDGELARLTWRFSDGGAAFDATADATTYVVFFLCVAAGLYRFTGRHVFLVLLGVLLVSMAVFYINLFRLSNRLVLKGNIVQVAKKIEAQPKLAKSGRLDKIASKLAFVFRRDFFATVVFLMTLAGGAAPLLVAVVLFSVIESIYMSIYARKEILRQKTAGAA